MLAVITYIAYAIIAFIIVMDVLMYIKLSALKSNKNLKVVYQPKLYQLGTIMYSLIVKKDLGHIHKTTVAEIKEGTDMVVLPSVTGLQRMFIPRSREAVTEFIKKENEYFERYNFIGIEGFLSHMFLKNKPAMKNRAFFSKIFHIKSMKLMLPGVRNIVRKHLDKLGERLVAENQGSKPEGVEDEPVTFDVKKDFMNALIDDLSTFLVFGDLSGTRQVKIQGKSFVEKTKDLFKVLVEIIISPVNMLSFGLARKYGMDPALNKMRRINGEIKGACIAEYKKRFNELASQLKAEQLDKKTGTQAEEKSGAGENCILNLMAKHNLSVDGLGMEENDAESGEGVAEQPLPIDMVADMILTFLFAGSDTSFNSTCSTLLLLAKNPESLKPLQNEIHSDSKLMEGNYQFEDLDAKPYLGACMMESLRLMPPAPAGFVRITTKKTTICGIEVDKGDQLHFSFMGQGVDPRCFKDRFAFNPDRILLQGKSAEYPKIHPTQLMPFSLGKRACLGKNLAEMTVKTILVEFLKKFEVVKDFGEVKGFQSDPGYCFADTRILVRLRDSSKAVDEKE